MAIGSTPEIGATFGLLRDMTADDLDDWWLHMRTHWHPNLLNGYATVVHRTTDNPYYEKREPHDKKEPPRPVAPVRADRATK